MRRTSSAFIMAMWCATRIDMRRVNAGWLCDEADGVGEAVLVSAPRFGWSLDDKVPDRCVPRLIGPSNVLVRNLVCLQAPPLPLPLLPLVVGCSSHDSTSELAG